MEPPPRVLLNLLSNICRSTSLIRHYLHRNIPSRTPLFYFCCHIYCPAITCDTLFAYVFHIVAVKQRIIPGRPTRHSPSFTPLAARKMFPPSSALLQLPLDPSSCSLCRICFYCTLHMYGAHKNLPRECAPREIVKPNHAATAHIIRVLQVTKACFYQEAFYDDFPKLLLS